MKSLAIDANSMDVIEKDVAMAANTIYSFFNSILIDELTTINGHVLYADANALSENKKAYFIGEQLIIGDTLIFAREDFNDSDVVITKDELSSLIIKDVNEFYLAALKLLSSTDINLYRPFPVVKNSETIELNNEWVLYAFNIADDRTKEYFLVELDKTLKAGNSPQEYLQKMATLALNAMS